MNLLPPTWVPGPLSEAERLRIAEEAMFTTAEYALEVGHYLGASTSLLLYALPPECRLVTIDHHKGDVSTPAADPADFRANVEPYIGRRGFYILQDDMLDALAFLIERRQRFGFVFYDADHTEEGVRAFWNLAIGLLEPRCTLIYDDADWPGQAVLGELAAADGFLSTRDRPIVRKMPADKVDRSTFTLEVMKR